MTLPAGYSSRIATEADIDAMLAVLHAGDIIAMGEPDTPRDFVEEVFRTPFLDPATDIWVVADPGGSIVACGDVQSVDPKVSGDAFARVHPDHRGRGISSALLDRAEARMRDRLDVGGSTKLWATAEPGDQVAQALLRHRGGEHIRSFFHMQRSLDGADISTPVPNGIHLRRFGDDDRREWVTFHRVFEATFVGHFGFEPIDLDTYVTMWESFPTWDPRLVTFAVTEAENDVVGFVVSNVTHTQGLGWLSDVGVLPAFRGRGIAKALLARAFDDLRGLGCDRVRLNVDADNVTGATGLYEAVGMHVRREWMVFEKTLVHAG